MHQKALRFKPQGLFCFDLSLKKDYDRAMGPERIYLDYNATAPLSPSVLGWLKSADLIEFANPSSVHMTGKKVKSEIRKTKEKIFKYFDLDPDEYSLIFHSGATEAINWFLLDQKEKGHALCGAPIDHSAAYNCLMSCQAKGAKSFFLPVDRQGQIDFSALSLLLEKHEKMALHLTYAHNETGVIQNIGLLKELKIKFPGLIVHADMVQTLGKAPHFKNPYPFDMLTFSGHKFGALKGVGFSFIKNSIGIDPLIFGGDQQEGLRSGTENTIGIFSLEHALKDLEQIDLDQQKAARDYLEQELKASLGEKIHFIQGERICNTSLFIFEPIDAQKLSMALDIEGLDVSNGSACSSHIVKPNRSLKAMGYSEELSLRAIRLSLAPTISIERSKGWLPRLKKVLERF